jgi:hypothetical protein
MTVTHTLPQGTLPGLAAIVDLQLSRLTQRLRTRLSAAATHHTRDTAASLYLRAARYEATQPGFAADLRAAAEAMDQPSARDGRANITR